MAAVASPRFTLLYWPLSFRGEFVRILFAYTETPYTNGSFADIKARRSIPFNELREPTLAPPFVHDAKHDRWLSQTPAIVPYVAQELGLWPADSWESAKTQKILCDAQDVMAGISRNNGSQMWTREEWESWRDGRFVAWLEVFERTGAVHGLTENAGTMLGSETPQAADLITYAVFGTMLRCLPELRPHLEKHAANVIKLCDRLGKDARIEALVKERTETVGTTYCGGQIGKSINDMLKE